MDRQPAWSDGTVGMFGDSYYGVTQWAAAASGHPALRAIVPRVTTADLGASRIGTWWDEGIPPLYGADYLAHYWVDRLTYEYSVDWTQRPLAGVFDEAFRKIGARSAAFDMMLRRIPFNDYPTGHPFETISIPVLHSVGWFDNIMPNSMQDYTTLRSRPHQAQLQYLVADAADHENYQLADVPITAGNDHYANDEALARLIPAYVGPSLEFFDVFLRGGDPSALPRVRWRLGHGSEQSSAAWPPPGSHELRLYLGHMKAAAQGPEGGTLVRAPDAVRTDATWIHDPEDLVPSTVQDPFAFLHEFPDERDVQCRDDVLTFTSEAMDTSLDLAGPVSAGLSVQTTGPSMHLFVKLTDVSPDGFAHMLVRGQALVRSPDPDRPVRIDLGHTGYRVQPGHRLRCQVASSDFPLFLWHPGTPDKPWTATRSQQNDQVLYGGGASASYVSLSVLDDQEQ
jgi:hypothetical protein